MKVNVYEPGASTRGRNGSRLALAGAGGEAEKRRESVPGSAAGSRPQTASPSQPASTTKPG